MNLLKQKKAYENQLMMMDNQSFNMDQMQFAHENIENTITMVAATKAASAVMKEKFKLPEMDIDAILDMQDDMAELLEESNEINEVLGQDYGIGDELDEDDLMAELDMLGDDMGDELMDANATPDYLSGPVADPGPPMGMPGQELDPFGLPVAPSGQPMPAQQMNGPMY